KTRYSTEVFYSKSSVNSNITEECVLTVNLSKNIGSSTKLSVAIIFHATVHFCVQRRHSFKTKIPTTTMTKPTFLLRQVSLDRTFGVGRTATSAARLRGDAKKRKLSLLWLISSVFRQLPALRPTTNRIGSRR